jgi:hypothetical protein
MSSTIDALAEREANLRALNEEIESRIQTVSATAASSTLSTSPLTFDLGSGDGDIEEAPLPSFSLSSKVTANLVASPPKDTSPASAPRPPFASSSTALKSEVNNRISGSKIPLRASVSIPKSKKDNTFSTNTRDDGGNIVSSGYGQSPPRSSSSTTATAPISSGSSAAALLMPDPDLPTDVQLKLLRAHLEHAIDEAASAERDAARLKSDLATSRKEVHKLSEEVARSTRTLSATETAANKARASAASAEARENDLRVQLQQLQQQQSTSSKTKHAGGSHNEPSAAIEARLHRAQDEIEKLRSQLATERKENTDAIALMKKDLEIASEKAKKSERQRGELLAAFKKQLKLVDILRRQRVHMEAARMLAFAEEEFVRIMEANQQVSKS